VQPVKGDFHDWDASAGPALITTRSGKRFLAAAAKDGYLYGIDRAAVPDRAGEAPDENALTVRYQALAATRENAEAPLTSTGMTRSCPGSQGGIEWNGPTYHRGLGTLYVTAIDWCASVKLKPVEKLKGEPGEPWTGMDHQQMAFGIQDPTSRWKGWVTAVDAETGEVRWKVQTPKPMVAGITATAGGVVLTGDLDGNVLAYDAQTGKVLWQDGTGKVLWQDGTGKAIGGGVISYEARGKQFVAAAAGLNSAIWPVTGGTARIVVYALP
jgi:alcohol dehydrogenase (cytochrome c)